MGERGRYQAADIDLPDPVRPGPSEQGVILDERQNVLDRGLMRLFDDSRHRRVGDRPQGRHRLDGRKRQVVAGDRLGSWPRVLGDLPRQFPGIDRLAVMFGEEELPGNLCSHPRPVSCRDRGVGSPSDGGVERRDAFGHLDPKRAQIVVDDLERRPQPRHVLKVLIGEVGSFELLLPQFR